MTATNWDKFRLLMWKNWLLQWRHKIQMFVEIMVPVVFSALLVLIRSLVDIEIIDTPMIYQPVEINTLEPLRNWNITPALTIDYRLLYSPQNDQLELLLNGVSESLHLNGVIGYPNSEAMENDLYGHPYLAGVDFSNVLSTSELPKHLVYSLRFPAELRTGRNNPLLFNWRTDLLYPRYQAPGPRNRNANDGGLPPGYRQEGFLAIQNAIATEYLKLQSNSLAEMPQIIVQRYPHPPYIRDPLLTGLENIVSLIIMLSFVYPCINTVKFIAAEKEKQLKEAMKIMGLPNWLHWTGWFVRSMLFMVLSISFMVILLKVKWYPSTDASVFTHTDWSTLWFFLFIYSIATATYCFMLSVFFSRANTAAAVSGLAWFIFYAAYTFTQQSYDHMSLSEKLLLCLLSNTGMAFGFQIILRYEGTGEGLQWNNFWSPVSVDDNLSVGLIVIMLLITALLYLLITLYIEKIYPGEYGVPERWYFPFTRTYWCGSSSEYIGIEDITHSIQNPDNFEDNPKGRSAGIQVRALRKIYANKKVAVNSLTLNMYDDQITVLLGHNGAGKTTTMSMLTGMFPPSSGTAIVNGRDIRTDIASVRSSLGLCPQHNILFDELTVREHIVFYSRLKGLDNEAVEKEVVKYVRLIDLEPKMNALSKTLSGGMKRKLSVCVAFCGGSKVVLCDEPTSGMDPAARRALWDVLQEEKKGRTVLLSTHFMDEADVLGDRIAIMSNGELKCCGSSYFLKKKFGLGYHLICVKGPQSQSEEITKLLRKYVPEAQIENDIGTELSYQLSDAKSDVFQEMFEELEYNMEFLGVESYGVSLTTLEEVFMSVGTDPEPKPEQLPPLPISNGNGMHVVPIDEFGSTSTLDYSERVPLLSGYKLAQTQIVALFKKKIIQTYRGWLLLIVQILIPASFIIITMLSERARGFFQALPRLHITLSSYLETVSVLETSPSAAAGSFEERFSNEYQTFVATNAPQSTVNVIQQNFETYILDLSKIMITRINRQYLVGASILNPTTITAWFNNQPFHTAPLSVGLVHNSVIRAHLGTDYSIEVSNQPLPYTPDSVLEMMQLGGSMGFQLAVNVGFAMAFVAAFYVLPYIRERQSRSKLLQFVSGAKVITFWITALIWDYLTYILTVIVLVVIFAAFQETGWSTPEELSRILLILVSFGFAVLPVTYIASMFFTVPASGFTRMTMFYVFTGMACFFIVFIMSMDIYDLQDVAATLKWIFLVFPHFALSHSLNSINMVTQMKELCRLRCAFQPLCTPDLMCMFAPECCENDYFKWEEPGIGRDLVYMYAVGVGALIWLLLIEYRFIAAIIYAVRKVFERDLVPTVEDNIDTDVVEERHRVKAMSRIEVESHSLVIKEMSKVYGKLLAVNQLSVGVDPSECFGLLGVNGAGKTSTFKMLTGDEKISSGEAWVRGISLKSNMNKVHQIIGYCPQFDALIDELTGRETLEMYCRLRGVPFRSIKTTSLSLANDLNFIKHIDKKVKEYSGGNKRKLSTAVALIGNPAVVYLDEPTTGMDPGAKRQLWNMICKIRKTGKSIVLTSHSMDECEALCTRLAIMVNGEFKCLGSVQHLKNKFSKGFTLTIKMKKSGNSKMSAVSHEDGMDEATNELSETLGEVREYIISNFPGAFLREAYQGLLTYYIPNSTLKWSTMFGLMEQAKIKFNIEDYSLAQTSLEQVFLAFAKYQKEETIERRN